MKEVEGFEDFVRACNSLAKDLEGPELTRAVKQGARLVQRAIRSAAPVDRGELRDGLVLVKEKARSKGKVVYQVTPTREKNPIFQKVIKKPVRSTASFLRVRRNSTHRERTCRTNDRL